MTFASELVRTAFHKIPTDRQVTYSRLEERLAADGMGIHVEAVTTDGALLEVVIRIVCRFYPKTVGPGTDGPE